MPVVRRLTVSNRQDGQQRTSEFFEMFFERSRTITRPAASSSKRIQSVSHDTTGETCSRCLVPCNTVIRCDYMHVSF